MTTLFNNFYFVSLNITKATLMPPPLIKQYQEKGKGHCCLGDLNMTKQDIGLQNFLNTRIFQWMYPQSLWHKCVVNHVPITCVTCCTWICVTIDVCWCDSCVDSCHLWCVCCKVGGCYGWITTISKLYVRGCPSFLSNLAMISTKLDLRTLILCLH